jgi:hypothetical protein
MLPVPEEKDGGQAVPELWVLEPPVPPVLPVLPVPPMPSEQAVNRSAAAEIPSSVVS